MGFKLISSSFVSNFLISSLILAASSNSKFDADSFLDGITRQCVIGIAKSKGIKITERKIKPNEMSNFIGCFLTGTAAEITPVSQIDNYKFTVCELIKGLSESYINLVRKKVAA